MVQDPEGKYFQDGHIGDTVLPCGSSIRTAIIDIFPLLTDLPFLTRDEFANNVSAIDLGSEMPGHVDIPRLRKGKVGGFFWWVKLKRIISYSFTYIIFRSVYVSCPNPIEAGRNFLGATWRVRYVLPLATCSILQHIRSLPSDTLEQIDVARLLISKYPGVGHHSFSRCQ